MVDVVVISIVVNSRSISSSSSSNSSSSSFSSGNVVNHKHVCTVDSGYLWIHAATMIYDLGL